MTLAHWIEAFCFVAVWLLAYGIYFRKDIARWWRERGPRRRREAEAEQNRRAAEARLRDELAAKYPLPPSARPKG